MAREIRDLLARGDIVQRNHLRVPSRCQQLASRREGNGTHGFDKAYNAFNKVL